MRVLPCCKEIKRNTQSRFSAWEKIRIVMMGIRGEGKVSEIYVINRAEEMTSGQDKILEAAIAQFKFIIYLNQHE